MQQQNLFKRMFQKSSWDPDNSAMLQQESKAFPYFGLVHYFLLKETGIGHGDYNSVAGRVAIHFNNAYLLNLQLHEIENASTTKNEIKINIAQTLINPEPTVEKLLTRQPAPADNTKEELLFEPLYTSDYFASQGIKLSEEVQPGDKLGNQLKSFTEWLKTMKKTTNYRLPENGATNPFLHLSMHLSIYEQLSIDQPPGIKELYLELCANLQDEHAAQHQIIDCLAEMIYQAQRNKQQPDPTIYLNCLQTKLGRK